MKTIYKIILTLAMIIGVFLIVTPKAISATSASSSASAGSSLDSSSVQSNASVSSASSSATSSASANSESSTEVVATASSTTTAQSQTYTQGKNITTKHTEGVTNTDTSTSLAQRCDNTIVEEASKSLGVTNTRLEDLNLKLDLVEERQIKTLNLFLYNFIALGVIIVLEIILLFKRR